MLFFELFPAFNSRDANDGEPGGNRTPNPQIKSLLLCQLSYRPQSGS